MELTMTNNFGFCELNENEMMMVDGGFDGAQFATGCIALGTTFFAAAAAIAAAPAVFAIGTTAFCAYGVACVAGATIGSFGSGYAIGDSFMH